MTTGLTDEQRYELRELSSWALATHGRADAAAKDIRRIALEIDRILAEDGQLRRKRLARNGWRKRWVFLRGGPR